MIRFSLGRFAGYLGLSAFILVVTGLTTTLILTNLVTPQMRDQVFCAIGIEEFAGDACVSARIAEGMVEVEQKLAAAKERQQVAESALKGRMIFTEGAQIDNATVVVGAMYTDHARREGLIKAICWLIHDKGGLDPRLTIAEVTAGVRPAEIHVDAYEQSALGISTDTVRRARGACPWPAEVG